MPRWIAFGILLICIGEGVQGQTPQLPPIGFEALPGLDDLPLLVDWPAYQASSYSRENKNQDAGNFVRIEPNGEQVLVDTDGPGVIYRLWSTGVVGTQMSDSCRLRFYFDDENAPRLDLSIRELFGGAGSQWPFVPPLAVTFESGVGPGEGPCNLSYVPIPFSRHLKITGTNVMFYHVDYHRLPPGTPIESFSRELALNHRESLERAVALWSAIPAPPSTQDAVHTTHHNLVLKPGKSRVFILSGPGVIRELNLALSDPSPRNLRGLVIQISFEGQAASVRAPVGDFFGTGAGQHLFASLFTGMTSTGYYACWPMPFRRVAVVELLNETAEPISISSFDIVHAQTQPPSNAGYFHARYYENPDIPMREDYHILDVRGRGKLVGCNVTMQNARKGQGIFFLEGDEKIYVDGEQWPTRWLGTGTEDYFNGAYFWNHPAKTNMARPLGGLTFLDWTLGRVCAYRWHFPDFVSFTNNIKLDLEHGGESDSPAHYASVAYYYLAEPSGQPPLPTLAERLPRTTLPPVPGFLCCEAAGPSTVDGKVIARQTFKRLSPEFESDDSLFLTQMKAGQRLQMPLRVFGEDEFQPVLLLPAGPGFGRLRVWLGQKVLGEVTVERSEPTPWIEAELAPIRLAAGLQPLELEVLPPEPEPRARRQNRNSKLQAGLVAVQFKPRSHFIDTWSIVGNWPCPKEGGWQQVWPPETNQQLTATFTLPDGNNTGWKPVNASAVSLRGGDWQVAYGLAYIWSEQAKAVPLFIGKDDGLKIWVNDAVVFDENTWSHAIPDQFFTTMKLRAGWNKLLVKCANWYGGWAYMLRPADPDRTLKFARQPK